MGKNKQKKNTSGSIQIQSDRTGSTTASDSDEQCQFFLTKKKRLCRFRPKPGQQYCPEHECIMGIETDRKRIPCPLNPTHNCYEDELEKHLRKCNVTKIKKAAQQASYYVEGINKGSADLNSNANSRKVCVRDLTSEELAAMIERVNALYAAHVEAIDRAVYEHPCVKNEYCGETGAGDLSQVLGEQAGLKKELLQQASLVGQLDKLDLLKDGHCYIELGAGKGKLSHWIQKSSTECRNNKFVLVERSSVRYKMDSYHKQGGDENNFNRIKIDIENLCLGRVPEARESDDVVVVGKHLCGGATDMGLHCAVNTLQDNGTDRDRGESQETSTASSHFSEHKAVNADTVSSNGKSAASPVASGNASKVIPPSESTNVETSSKERQNPSITASPNVPSSTSSQNNVGEERTVKELECSGSKSGQRIGETQTDRSTAFSNKTDEMQEPPAKSRKVEDKETHKNQDRLPKAIVIALCCHHRCTWDTYVGREFMHTCQISPDDFDLLTRLSSWAVCAKTTGKSKRIEKLQQKDQDNPEVATNEQGKDTADDGSNEHNTEDLMADARNQSLRETLSVVEREEIGRKCKRIIDMGRLHFLRASGMTCFLREYIDEDLTPENIVLVAYKSGD